MAEVYEEAGIEPTFGTLSENFLPRNYFVMQQRWKGGWAPWHVCYASNDLVPGFEGGAEPPLYWGIPMTEAIPSLGRLIWNLVSPDLVHMLNPVPPISGTPTPGEGHGPLEKVLDEFALFGTGAIVAVVQALDPDEHLHAPVAFFLSGVRRMAWALADAAPDCLQTRRTALATDFVLTHAIGLMRDGLLDDDDAARHAAWGPLDEIDWRDWLKSHGARPMTADSCFTRIFYDAIAAYDGGLESQPAFAASAAIRALLSSLTNYRGAFAYQMAREIGDSCVAPWVAALEQRGVTFHYFHRVRELIPNVAGTHIDAVQVEVQANVLAPPYDPFVSIAGRPCWRGAPDWPQLDESGVDGDDLHTFYTQHVRGTTTLSRGTDYDELVFALPIQVATFVCPKLIADASKPWSDAVLADPGVATQSLRMYLNAPRKDFWGDHPAPVLGAYVHDFATWEDNEEMMAWEGWGADPPKAIATVFGAMPTAPLPAPPWDSSFPGSRNAIARMNALQFCQNDAAALWPGLDDGGGSLDWSVLYDPRNGGSNVGSVRFAYQHVVANDGPYERYSQVLPKTLKKRMTQGGSGYDGLWLAGDWTRNGVEIACIEGAVLSGVLCANHLLTQEGITPTDPYYWIIPV